MRAEGVGVHSSGGRFALRATAVKYLCHPCPWLQQAAVSPRHRGSLPVPCPRPGCHQSASCYLQPCWKQLCLCSRQIWKCATFCQTFAVSLPNIIFLISCRFQYKSFCALLLGNLCKYISHMERCVSLYSAAVNDAAS